MLAHQGAAASPPAFPPATDPATSGVRLALSCCAAGKGKAPKRQRSAQKEGQEGEEEGGGGEKGEACCACCTCIWCGMLLHLSAPVMPCCFAFHCFLITGRRAAL